MADTYLIANAPYGATDVLLVTSAASGAATTAPTAGGAVPYPNPLPPHRPQRRPDDEEALLVAALI